MAEPVKIKFEYQSPENVEAEVPGAQTIREGQSAEEIGETPTNNGETSSNSEEMSKDSPKNEGRVPSEDGAEVVPRPDRPHVFSGKRNGIHGEPVMLEKLDDKKSKTKIPVSGRFRQTVEKVREETRGAKKEHESHIPVRRSSIPKPTKEKKLPPTAVKKEITITKSIIKNDSSEPVVTKTVITKEITEPTSTTTHTETIITKSESKSEIIEPEDEFDKIYAEIVTETPTEAVLADILLNPKVEDPEKLESKFEEIIHDYDEHRIEPIDVEVVRRSKLPLLKRKSQQEIQLSAQAERTSKIIAARDKLRLRHSKNMDENFEEALDNELRKSEANLIDSEDNKEADTADKDKPTTKIDTEIETEHEIITSPNSKTEITRQFTKTISSSSSHEQENVASSSIIETTTIEKVSSNEKSEKKEHKEHFITEENIIKGSLHIGIPVFDSFIHEISETNETARTTDIKKVLSYTSTNEELFVTNNLSASKNEFTISEVKQDTNENFKSTDTYFDASKTKDSTSIKSNNAEIVTVESLKSVEVGKSTENPEKVERSKDENVQLRNKMDRIINKIDSKEVIETEGHQRESINELRKKKSVLSKIAMFERKPEETLPIRAPKKEFRVPKLITRDLQKPGQVHVHTPLIVDEVFKPFKTDTSLYDEGNIDDIPSKSDEFTMVIRAERVTLESPNTVHYAAENKVQIENKTEQIVSELISSENNIETVHKKAIKVISTQADIDSQYTVQKVEISTVTDVLPPKESNIINDFASPRPNIDKFEYKDVKSKVNPVKLRISRELSKTNNTPSPSPNSDQFAFNDFRNKALSPTRLSMTKELQSPVIIPGFKPVSELLRSFESKRDTERSFTKRSVSKIEHSTIIDKTIRNSVTDSTVNNSVTEHTQMKLNINDKQVKNTTDTSTEVPEIPTSNPYENRAIYTQVSNTDAYNNEVYDDFEIIHDYKSLDDVFSRDTEQIKLKLRQEDDFKRAKSLAELDLGDAVKGKVNNMILRMKSVDKIEVERKEAIVKKEMPRKRSVSEKIALFEGKLTPSRSESPLPLRIFKTEPAAYRTEQKTRTNLTETNYKTEIRRENATEVAKNSVEEQGSMENDQEVLQKKIEELSGARIKYGTVDNLPEIELSNGVKMPVMAIGTALLDPRLIHHIISAAIDLGYRGIDAAFIYGNEREVGQAIRAKIADGTVKREELFIISKLWSTYHRTELVEAACRASLEAMGLDYFDLYLIHNPMSFKEGGAPIPKIATVLQYSEYDYLDAWYGMEVLISKGLARAVGVSNFNSVQLQRVLDKGRVKPVINQVECHPYLSQQRLDLFCSERNVTLGCFGVLGSKGTPPELKNGQPAVIDDPLVQVMASGLGITPAQLLISYQLENNHSVVVKASSAKHLHDNLHATGVALTSGQVDALHALNRNKRMFTFKGMGDTHKNYPFNIAF